MTGPIPGPPHRSPYPGPFTISAAIAAINAGDATPVRRKDGVIKPHEYWIERLGAWVRTGHSYTVHYSGTYGFGPGLDHNAIYLYPNFIQRFLIRRALAKQGLPVS